MKPHDNDKITWVTVYRREPTLSSDMVGLFLIFLWLSEMDAAMPWFLKALSACLIFFGNQQILGKKTYRAKVNVPDQGESK